MADRTRLTVDQIAESIKAIPEWSLSSGSAVQSITRTFEAPSFLEGIALVQGVGEIAESRDHHPDIDIRYNRVTLTLSTHDKGGLTGWDFDVARAIDAL
jgi:4a-hydroxytetrahydrobiopterin dehydratase